MSLAVSSFSWHKGLDLSIIGPFRRSLLLLLLLLLSSFRLFLYALIVSGMVGRSLTDMGALSSYHSHGVYIGKA